jgi:aromatic-L-amino-acid decarboxylase
VKRLEDRQAPLDMDPTLFRAIGHDLVDRIAEFLETLPERPVTAGEAPPDIRRALDATRPIPESGDDPAALVSRATDLLLEHSLFNSQPKFWGYITAPAAPIGILGDFLATAMNQNCGAWLLSPMASEIEAQTIRWIAQLIAFPEDCGGILVSGGNMANMVCFAAARQAKAGWDARTAGLHGGAARRLRAYCSREAHTWVQKAADLAGIGTEGVCWIDTDAELRMDPGALRARIRSDREAGHQPFLVVGTAGSVSTGAIDPLPELARICREEGLWFHVDGAYGGLAAMLPDAPPDLRGLGAADSVAVDPHKWLYSPLEAGCALVRDASALRAAFAYHPPYYHFGVEAVNYFDFGPQNSRGNRAVKVWLALQQVGRSGYQQMLSDDIRLAEALHARVLREPELEAGPRGLSITTFRYVPPGLTGDPASRGAYLNELNTELLTRMQAGGEAYVSNAVVDGVFLLRACVVNFRTTLSDIEALPPLTIRLGREVDREMRESAPPAR